MENIIKTVMEAGETPLLIGEAGIGKTTIIHNIAKKTGRRIIEIPLQVMDAEDFIGLVTKTEDGKFDFLLPKWFPTNPNEKVILFLDEINRSTRRVRGALLKIVLEHTLNGHKLPKDTWIAAAMNPSTDDYEVDEIMDQAFLSRFVKIDMRADTDDWLKWAKKNKLNKYAIGFIAENRNWLLTKPKSEGATATNPRTWEKVSNLLNAMTVEQIEKYGFEVLKNQIGMECTRSFLNFVKDSKSSIKPEDFISKPESIKATVKSLPDDKKNVLIIKVIDYVIEKMNNKLDYTDDFLRSLDVLRSAFNRENLAGAFRYLTELSTKDSNIYAQQIMEELSATKIGEEMYKAMSLITENG